LLQADNITIKYGQRIAVSDVSLSVRAGEITTILGPNGAGKSTLLRALNGAVKLSSGQVLLEGQPLHRYPRRVISRQIAVVAQEGDVRFPVTVLEFVLGGRYAAASTGAWGWESDHDINVAQKVLRETELSDLSGRLMSELSGGERQRAVLGRALATEATILLLDEPTANLDLAHQAAILALVRARSELQKVAAVVVTHDINLAAEFSNHVLLMKNGHGVAFGRPAEVLTPELLREVFNVPVLVDAHPITGVPRVTPVHEVRR
jgi:ABC-type cobalamin/Fe3+-siderophores transport system ATPase subunit